MDYVLISVPTKAFNRQVGTLSELIALSDDLAKHDQFVMSVTVKLANILKDLAATPADAERTMQVDGRSLPEATEHFSWDMARYNVKQLPRELAQQIIQDTQDVEVKLKTKSQGFNKIKGNLQAIERKSNGSLLIKSLANVVKPEHVVRDSEFLVTLLVVVPKLVAEDAEYGLYTVTVFRKIVEDFKQNAREKKFVVRDFEFDAEEIAKDEHELNELRTNMVKQQALRVFVESVLRFGLPPDFTATLLKINNGNTRKVRQILGEEYAALDRANAAGADVVDIPGVTNQGEYYPYVSFDVELAHFVDKR
ncbi:uncharacterized protein MONBRDRAFT_9843 [Monosiga brevicollis MX1]|uniref:V-type proton ATPase subunit C n=1 Tax=Monosiga brevicollis TaxID=81824 RepID=A9V4E3_MONBE|nr:uncharacterized protein MONBRDRAFT_9843 [Monosiga brevicollis MX1]EDQ87695.1 predicted protein [Monosiga brevicollis MX1]|eukprot:XP_001747615.1 hypothetical protein [Monosiga brevicollis MX1]